MAIRDTYEIECDFCHRPETIGGESPADARRRLAAKNAWKHNGILWSTDGNPSASEGTFDYCCETCRHAGIAKQANAQQIAKDDQCQSH